MKRNVIVVFLYAVIFPKRYILRMIDKSQLRLEKSKIELINKALMQNEIFEVDVGKVEFMIDELVFYQIILHIQTNGFIAVYYARFMFLIVFIICLLHFL